MNIRLLAAFLLANISAFADDADLKANVSAAAKKLVDQSSYQWRTTIRTEGGGPPQSGMLRQDFYPAK